MVRLTNEEKIVRDFFGKSVDKKSLFKPSKKKILEYCSKYVEATLKNTKYENERIILMEEKNPENEFEEMSPYLLSKEKSRLENRLKKIEENSKLLDEKLKQLESDFVNPEIASDFKKLMEIQAEIENTQISNSKLEEEWLEKNENLEKINAILNKPENEE